jgi:hypothetical protein
MDALTGRIVLEELHRPATFGAFYFKYGPGSPVLGILTWALHDFYLFTK